MLFIIWTLCAAELVCVGTSETLALAGLAPAGVLKIVILDSELNSE